MNCMMFCTIRIIHNECSCHIMSVQHTSTNVTDEDYAIPLSTSYDAVQYSPAHYQPLDTVTTDYTSVYTTPTGRRGPPSVEVEGKMYSIVDPIKRETDTT